MADRNTRIRSSQIFDGGIKPEDLADETKTSSIVIIADGAGSEIQTGLVADVIMPFNAVILEVTLLADQTGSIVFDIYKDAYANHPASTSITASAKPTISSSNKSQDSTLTGWTTVVSSGDILRFNVDSVSTITKCSLNLKVKRT